MYGTLTHKDTSKKERKKERKHISLHTAYAQTKHVAMYQLTMSLTISSVDLPMTGTPFTSNTSSPSRSTSADTGGEKERGDL